MEPGNLYSKKERRFPLSVFQQKSSCTEVAGLLEPTNAARRKRKKGSQAEAHLLSYQGA